MNIKKIVSAAVAFALSASVFAGFGVTASAATVNGTFSNAVTAYGGGTSDAAATVVVYSDTTAADAMKFNNSKKDYYRGVSVIEFDVPAVNADRIVSASLTYSLHNEGNRGGNRTYTVYGPTNNITIEDGTTLYGDVFGTMSTVLYDGAGLYDGSYRTDVASSDAITSYVKSKVNSESASKVQFAFSNAAQQFAIYTKDTTVNETAYAAPELSIETGNIITFNTKLNDVAVENVPIVIGEETYTTDENGTVDVLLPAGNYNYSIEQSATYKETSGTVDISAGDQTVNVTLEEQTAVSSDLTLRYVDGEGNEIKSVAATNDAFVNVEYALTDDEKATFEYTVDEVKYRAAVTTTAVTPDAATDTCDVVCDIDKYITVNVNAVGGVEKTLTTISGFEGDSVSYVFPMYVLDNGIVYETAALSGTYYGTSATLTEGTDVEHTYTQKYENVVLYDELDGSTGQNASVRASNCSAYDNSAYTSSTEIEPGIYTIVARFYNKGRASTMTIGDTVAIDASTAGGSWNTNTYTNVVVTEAAPLVWNAGGSGTYDPIDTVVVIKTADLPSLEVAVAATDGETALPAATAETAIYNADGTSANTTYGALTADMVVKTVYAKVANTEDVPVVSIGGVEQESVWTEVGETGIYFAQFIGAEADFAEGGAFETVVITCGDLEESITW